MIWDGAEAAATISCLLLVIMCSAVMCSQLMTFTGAASRLGELVAAMALAPPIMLFVMLALPFVLFMFLDQVAIMLILIPIYQPLLKLYGFGEIWFWTLFLVITVVGGLTPPFGYILFAMKSAAPEISTTELYSAAWPFVWIIVGGAVLMALYPPIITFLPSLAGP
jgi:TRAP-type C4-dicarboxylate transport system permease large subunit